MACLLRLSSEPTNSYGDNEKVIITGIYFAQIMGSPHIVKTLAKLLVSGEQCCCHFTPTLFISWPE